MASYWPSARALRFTSRQVLEREQPSLRPISAKELPFLRSSMIAARSFGFMRVYFLFIAAA
jgi:hypothetical protein